MHFLASQPGLSLTTRRMAKTAHVSFDETVQKVIAQAADDHGLEHISLLSGAGHDAQEIAVRLPGSPGPRRDARGDSRPDP